MYGIHEAIMERLESILQMNFITYIDPSDDTLAGVVKQGPLQGDPEDPDEARISVTLHENDPDDIRGAWRDVVVMTEIPAAITFARRFTLKVRILLERTAEDLGEARRIASRVKERMEIVLLAEKFTGVSSGNETVSRPIMSRNIDSTMLQGGGPPDAYEFNLKVRFDVWTTRTGVYS